jgi:PIN domain nuclease of toxin-antitoxin system
MRQPFLLDTCAALWVVSGRLPQKTVDVLAQSQQAGFATYVSPITAWEVAQLARKGRFASSLTPERWFEHLMSAPGAALADMPPKVLMASAFLPNIATNDPADRVIAATAREYGYTVVTTDGALLEYGKQGYLSVLKC